jgi:hypothetical protein
MADTALSVDRVRARIGCSGGRSGDRVDTAGFHALEALGRGRR